MTDAVPTSPTPAAPGPDPAAPVPAADPRPGRAEAAPGPAAASGPTDAAPGPAAADLADRARPAAAVATDVPAPTPPTSPRQPAPPSWPAPTPRPTPSGPFALAWDRFWERGRPAGPVVLVAATVTGVLGGALILDNKPGLGLAVTGLAVLTLPIPGLLRDRRRFDLLILALAMVLVVAVAVRDAPWLVALSVLGAALLAAVAASGAVTAGAVLLSPVTAGLAALRAVPWVTRGLGALAGARRNRWGAVVRSALVTVVLLAVFTALFAGADAVFAAHLPTLALDELPGRVVLGALVAWGAVTLVHLSVASPGWSTLPASPRAPAGLVEWAVPVGALAALQVTFLGLQLATAVRGHDYVQATAGVGYAEYAREGFGQLLVVTVLTLLVVAFAARRAPRGTAVERLVTRIVLAVLLLALLGVVGSALRRMALYVDAFGLTRLRIVATAGELALGVVVLLVLVAGIRWRGAWLARGVVVVAAAALVGLVVVNPDALILRHNTAIARETDLAYLRDLSADAAPAAAALSPEVRDCVLPWLVPEPDAAAGWNLARARAGGLGVAPAAGRAVPEACR